jgi:hypothetical protein
MSSKHTPGPWQVGFADGSGHSYITNLQGRVVVRGGYDYHGIKHGVVKKSDARLIASAPDLLAVARLVDDVADRVDHEPDSAFGQLVDAARAAIAKATGEAACAS